MAETFSHDDDPRWHEPGVRALGDDTAAATRDRPDRLARRAHLRRLALLALAALFLLGLGGLVAIAAAAAHSSRDLSAHDHIFGVHRPAQR